MSTNRQGPDESQADKSVTTPQDNVLANAAASKWRRVCRIVFWTPPNARWNPDKPPTFSMALNLLFASAGAFTVANLYYSHPILNILARDFDVPYVKVSQIPTLAQAGYAVGLLFLCPLGDILERRPFILVLIFFTASLRYAYLSRAIFMCF